VAAAATTANALGRRKIEAVVPQAPSTARAFSRALVAELPARWRDRRSFSAVKQPASRAWSSLLIEPVSPELDGQLRRSISAVDFAVPSAATTIFVGCDDPDVGAPYIGGEPQRFAQRRAQLWPGETGSRAISERKR